MGLNGGLDGAAPERWSERPLEIASSSGTASSGRPREENLNTTLRGRPVLRIDAVDIHGHPCHVAAIWFHKLWIKLDASPRNCESIPKLCNRKVLLFQWQESQKLRQSDSGPRAARAQRWRSAGSATPDSPECSWPATHRLSQSASEWWSKTPIALAEAASTPSIARSQIAEVRKRRERRRDRAAAPRRSRSQGATHARRSRAAPCSPAARRRRLASPRGDKK